MKSDAYASECVSFAPLTTAKDQPIARSRGIMAAPSPRTFCNSTVGGRSFGVEHCLITKLEIENFKAYGERVSFDLRPLTVLIGANGSGKSSALESIGLL